MDYMLTVGSRTYPVEEVRIPSEAILEAQPEGKPFFFVSPIPVTPGKHCSLVGDAGTYELSVGGCFGFNFALKYQVSGTICGRLANAHG